MDGSTDLDAWMGGFNYLTKQRYKFMMYLINFICDKGKNGKIHTLVTVFMIFHMLLVSSL